MGMSAPEAMKDSAQMQSVDQAKERSLSRLFSGLNESPMTRRESKSPI
jgi:hypothetical protein